MYISYLDFRLTVYQCITSVKQILIRHLFALLKVLRLIFCNPIYKQRNCNCLLIAKYSRTIRKKHVSVDLFSMINLLSQ